MKSILCFGDSNVWGNIPGTLDPETGLSQRYSKEKRWTGILQKCLGETYEIINEGINARTTNLDEITPGRPFKNGLTYLPFCLETHYPVDLVILWLGTNDTKIQFNRSTIDIKEAMKELIQCINSSNKGAKGHPPKILLIAAQPILQIENLHFELDDASVKKSQQIAEAYEALAEEEQCGFLNIGSFVKSSPVDGIHLDESSGTLVAEKIAAVVKKML